MMKLPSRQRLIIEGVSVVIDFPAWQFFTALEPVFVSTAYLGRCGWTHVCLCSFFCKLNADGMSLSRNIYVLPTLYNECNDKERMNKTTQ
jgi:hypothetical protein